MNQAIYYFVPSLPFHYAAEEDYLKYWFIRRFSGGITFYFVSNMKMGWLDPNKDLKFLSFDKIRDYQLLNFKALTEMLESEYINTKGQYEELNANNFELPVYY